MTRGDPGRLATARDDSRRLAPERNPIELGDATRTEMTRGDPGRHATARDANRREPTRRDATRREPTRTDANRREPTRRDANRQCMAAAAPLRDTSVRTVTIVVRIF